MTEVILGHPYSGALYAYFADQLQGDHSHTRSNSSYYKTLYGKHYQRYVEIALNFLLLYRHLWVTLADNPLPITSLTPEDLSAIPELGLHLGYRRFESSENSYYERREAIQAIVRDPQIRDILGRRMKLPWRAWEQVVDSVVFEASLSANKRIPLLCSAGRKELIHRIVTIDRPSLHPIVPDLHHAIFIQSYCEFTALALTPKDLDDLVAIKLDSKVRAYGDELLKLAHEESPQTTRESRLRVAELVKEAMHTEIFGNRVSGILEWVGRFARLIQEPSVAATASAGAFASDVALSSAGWYQFTGSVNRAIELRQLETRIDTFLATKHRDA